MHSIKLLSIKIITLLSLFALVGCSGKSLISNNKKDNNLHMLQASVWFKHSGENRALQYQAFNYAKLMVQKYLYKKSKSKSKKKPAIVVDVDETILNNVPYQEFLVKTGESYPVKWFDWVKQARAEPIPGSVEFLQYAHKKGFEIFYVSNRKVRAVDATYKNLIAYKLPAKKKNLLFREKKSSKKSRRNLITSKNYEIVLLIGDNLNDFADVFDETSMEKRIKLVDKLKRQFGKKFVVLPNPLYGDWEAAMIDYNWKMSLKEKNDLKKSLLDESTVLSN